MADGFHDISGIANPHQIPGTILRKNRKCPGKNPASLLEALTDSEPSDSEPRKLLPVPSPETHKAFGTPLTKPLIHTSLNNAKKSRRFERVPDIQRPLGPPVRPLHRLGNTAGRFVSPREVIQNHADIDSKVG